MQSVFVFGAGGHSKVAIDAIRRSGVKIQGVIDDDPGLWGSTILGFKVTGGRSAIESVARSESAVVVAIARNEVRKRVVNRFANNGLAMLGVRHPCTITSDYAEIASTAQIMAGVVINAGARIAEHVVLNSGCIIEHDVQIDAFAHIGPGATLAGGVCVGEGAFVCTNACAKPMMHIGAWSTIGAGGAVVTNVPDKATVVGIPARLLRQNRYQD